MKRLVEDLKGSHLEMMLGETITVFCCRYIYSGKLISVDDFSIALDNAGIVYETGELDSAGWQDRQALPKIWNIALSSIESFGVLKV